MRRLLPVITGLSLLAGILVGPLVVAAPAPASSDEADAGGFFVASGRILDTRTGLGRPSGPVPAGATITFAVGPAATSTDGSSSYGAVMLNIAVPTALPADPSSSIAVGISDHGMAWNGSPSVQSSTIRSAGEFLVESLPDNRFDVRELKGVPSAWFQAYATGYYASPRVDC